MSIELGLHIWSLNGCTVDEAAAITRALGLSRLDLGNARDVDLVYIADHVEEEIERFRNVARRHGIQFVDAFPQAPPAFADQERRIIGGFLRFAQGIGLSGVTLGPGRFRPGEETPEESFQRSAERLRWAVEEASKLGLALRIEPHIGSITWTPELAVRMCQEVPGLTLTIDHSHFIFHSIPYEQIAVMHPYGTHWHARQARPGNAQVRTEEGEIDFERILDDLSERNYNGVVCLEYVHARGGAMGMVQVDCLAETIKLRDALQDALKRREAGKSDERGA